MPFGPDRRFLNHSSEPVSFFAGGWTASATVAIQTGFPFSPQPDYNAPGNGDTRTYLPRWSAKNRAISSNASLVSGALVSRIN